MRTRAIAASVALVAALVGGLAPTADARSGRTARRGSLLPLHAVRGTGAHIADSADRQVLLRGVNTNQLGDYYQDNPSLPATIPLTESDVADMAALGFNSIRLLVHWSKLEPTPGVIDDGYVDQVRRAVGWAARHGVYVVIDMHQDAWGKYIATPKGQSCPPVLQPAIGWDGAPEWATKTDGLTTCREQLREASPAVAQAFSNFWADRDGIQGHLVNVWAALAKTFAADPTVAGYDLVNEPHPGWTPGATDVAFLGLYYRRAIGAIRAAEASAPGGFPHIAFVEPMDTWSAAPVGVSPLPGVVDDPNLVFAPHLYAGSITADRSLGVELFAIPAEFDEAQREADRFQTTFWSGEWGWFGDPAADAPRVAEYGRQEDAHVVGGAWWQWKQACGDPHNIGTPGGRGVTVSPSLVRVHCPDGATLGVPPPLAAILSRAFPRAAPGHVQSLTSDPATGHFALAATAERPGSLDVWLPVGATPPRVTKAVGLRGVRITSVPGGYHLTAEAHGAYSLEVDR